MDKATESSRIPSTGTEKEEIVFCGRTATELWSEAESMRRDAIENWQFDGITALRSAVAFLKSSGILHPQ